MGISVSVVKTEPVEIPNPEITDFVSHLANIVGTDIAIFNKDELEDYAKEWGGSGEAVTWVNTLPFEEDVITLQFWY